MAAEAAALGVPAVCPNSYDFGYLRALEHEYELIFRPDSFEESVRIAEEILQDPNHGETFAQRRQRLLADSQDVTQFMVDMVDRAAREHPVR